MRKTVAIVAYPGVQLLDITGPYEVFATAEKLRPGSYRVVLAAREVGPVVGSSGLAVVAAQSTETLRAVDTLVVAGGEGTREAASDAALIADVRRAAARSRRVASVCSGAFVLAAAGLLDGRRAATHWTVCDLLGRLFPDVTVDADAIYVRDGNVWTSAGVTAGIDLALALVEEDHGPDLALAIARHLVMFVRRPGGQSQFSVQLALPSTQRHWLRDLLTYISEHPDTDLAVDALAQRAHVSARHLARTFTHELGTTPAVYVERVRVEMARRLLEDTSLTLDRVASAAGFGSIETLRRAFARVVGVAPSDYRARFRVAS